MYISLQNLLYDAKHMFFVENIVFNINKRSNGYRQDFDACWHEREKIMLSNMVQIRS